MLDKKLFKTSEVKSKEFEFPAGKAKLHFKVLSSADAGLLFGSFFSKDRDDKSDTFAWAIQRSLCNSDGSQVNGDGTPVITMEQVKQLKYKPFQQILQFVFEINGDDDSEK